MRPIANQKPEELYECYNCGSRDDATEGRVCDDCGGPLRNIGRSRDL